MKKLNEEIQQDEWARNNPKTAKAVAYLGLGLINGVAGMCELSKEIQDEGVLQTIANHRFAFNMMLLGAVVGAGTITHCANV